MIAPNEDEVRIAIAHLAASRIQLRMSLKIQVSPKIKMSTHIEMVALERVIGYLESMLTGPKKRITKRRS